MLYKQRMKSKLSLFSECVETKLCKPCTSFISHLHSSCGMACYRALRVNTWTIPGNPISYTYIRLLVLLYGVLTGKTGPVDRGWLGDLNK